MLLIFVEPKIMDLICISAKIFHCYDDIISMNS